MAEFSTQDFLEIKDIKEGVLLLKNNELRGVMMVSSINFALKSEEEKDAIIYGFQSFLNSLDFHCQIIVQSRRLNITPYIEKLKELEEKQKNELLKIQIAEYREFIRNLTIGSQIMNKNFFIVVPYRLGELLGVKAIARTSFIQIGTQKEVGLSDEDFQRCKAQLYSRMEYVAAGLRRCQLKAVPLNTIELIELFWSWHHPEEAEVGYFPEILPELLK